MRRAADVGLTDNVEPSPADKQDVGLNDGLIGEQDVAWRDENLAQVPIARVVTQGIKDFPKQSLVTDIGRGNHAEFSIEDFVALVLRELQVVVVIEANVRPFHGRLRHYHRPGAVAIRSLTSLVFLDSRG